MIEGKIIREDEKKIWVATFGNAKIGINRDDIQKIVPKEFVIPKNTKSKPIGSNKTKPSQKKYRYGTMTAEVTYTKTSKGSSLDSSSKKSSCKIAKYRDGKAIEHKKKYHDNGMLRKSVRMEGGQANGRYDIFYKSGI